jgi:hypothetical protein
MKDKNPTRIVRTLQVGFQSSGWKSDMDMLFYSKSGEEGNGEKEELALKEREKNRHWVMVSAKSKLHFERYQIFFPHSKRPEGVTMVIAGGAMGKEFGKLRRPWYTPPS